MDEKYNVHPTRQLSDRKSKPSMEALIDQHKRVIWSPPRHNRFIDELHPPISNIANIGTLEEHFSDNIAKPLRIRIQVPKLDLSTDFDGIPNSQHPIQSDEHQFVSAILNPIISPTKPASNGIEDPNAHSSPIDTDEDEEDDMPLADLCKFEPTQHESLIQLPSDSIEVISDREELTDISVKLSPDAVEMCPDFLEIFPVPPPTKIEICHLKSCQNAANITDTRWDGQFCSSDCLIKACRQSFKAHILHHRTSIFSNHHKFVS